MKQPNQKKIVSARPSQSRRSRNLPFRIFAFEVDGRTDGRKLDRSNYGETENEERLSTSTTVSAVRQLTLRFDFLFSEARGKEHTVLQG
jgi:hypothetical protein